MADRNAYFQLRIADDGTYLILYPPEGQGIGIKYSDLETYLTRRGIEFNHEEVAKASTKVTEKTEIKVTEKKIYPVNEIMEISAREDRSEAEAIFYPPSNGGQRLTREDINGQLTRSGIKFGVIEDNINMFLKEHIYNKYITIAQAKAPKYGQDAKIEYHFNTDMSRKPKTNEDGSVDFHHIDVVCHVTAGELLATLTKAVDGEAGMNISGVPIQAPKVNNRQLKYGKNIRISEDGCQIFSEVNGHVQLVDGTVFVSDVYQVPANVDASTGDITYNGNVEVVGNVNTGYRIEANGDVTVNGVVEGAYIKAGGQIILKCGIQGMGKGELYAGGNIISKFIESATVYAGGYITTETIMHSKVMADGDITVGGKKGLITGGEIHSTTMITAKTIGSVMGTPTSLEVGVSPVITEELNALNEETENMNKELEQMTPVLNKFAQLLKLGQKLDPVKMQQVQLLVKKKKDIEAALETKYDRISALNEIIDNCTDGCIRADDVMYQGVKMTIAGVTGFARNESKHCRFVRDGADIRAAAY